jgi:hypothetical protein
MLSLDALDGENIKCTTYTTFPEGPQQAPPSAGDSQQVPPNEGAQQLPPTGETPQQPQPPQGIVPQGIVPCDEADDGLSRLSARSYGNEWLLRRDYKEKLSGWLSYTLAKAEGHTEEGARLVPNFDVRHIANLVFQWRITPRWHVSLRGFAQSGRYPLGAGGSLDPRERERLPAFYRGDLNISRIWQRSWGEIRVSLDWLNFTFQREPLSWYCRYGSEQNRACKVEYVSFPITLPILGVRGSY